MTDKNRRLPESNSRHEDSRFPELAKLFLWADDEKKVEKVVLGLAIFCAVTFVIDLFYHRHAYFSFEGSRGFYPIAGFFAFTVIVLAAGQLRRLIKRPENYYGRRATNAETYPDDGLEIQVADGFAAPRDKRSVIPPTVTAEVSQTSGDAANASAATSATNSKEDSDR